MNKRFLKFSIIISILYNIGAIFTYGFIINGLAINPLPLWELLSNVAIIGIPLLILSYFEYRLLSNVNNESITVKEEVFLWTIGAIRVYLYMLTGLIGILNLVSAYIVRKERKKSF